MEVLDALLNNQVVTAELGTVVGGLITYCVTRLNYRHSAERERLLLQHNEREKGECERRDAVVRCVACLTALIDAEEEFRQRPEPQTRAELRQAKKEALLAAVTALSLIDDKEGVWQDLNLFIRHACTPEQTCSARDKLVDVVTSLKKAAPLT